MDMSTLGIGCVDGVEQTETTSMESDNEHDDNLDYTGNVPETEEALYISESCNKNPRSGRCETPSMESGNENEDNPDYHKLYRVYTTTT